MDQITADLMKALAPIAKDVLSDAIKIIAPAGIAALVGYITVKRQFQIERVRLHEKDTVEAYKRLLRFSRDLRNDTFPLAEDKRQAFLDLMKVHFFGKLEQDYVYFPDEVTKLLDELEYRYTCVTRGELIPEMDEKEESQFIEHELFEIANRIAACVKKVMRTKKINA